MDLRYLLYLCSRYLIPFRLAISRISISRIAFVLNLNCQSSFCLYSFIPRVLFLLCSFRNITISEFSCVKWRYLHWSCVMLLYFEVVARLWCMFYFILVWMLIGRLVSFLCGVMVMAVFKTRQYPTHLMQECMAQNKKKKSLKMCPKYRISSSNKFEKLYKHVKHVLIWSAKILGELNSGL